MRVPHELMRAPALLLLATLAACHSLQPVPVSFIPSASPQVVYLSDGNGVTQAVANPRLSGDTVVGTVVGGDAPIAVPLDEVQRIATVRVNRARTVFLLGAVTVGSGLLAYAILTHAAGDGSEFCDYDNQPNLPGTECGYHSNP